jgi:hypothetical protein
MPNDERPDLFTEIIDKLQERESEERRKWDDLSGDPEAEGEPLGKTLAFQEAVGIIQRFRIRQLSPAGVVNRTRMAIATVMPAWQALAPKLNKSSAFGSIRDLQETDRRLAAVIADLPPPMSAQDMVKLVRQTVERIESGDWIGGRSLTFPDVVNGIKAELSNILNQVDEE